MVRLWFGYLVLTVAVAAGAQQGSSASDASKPDQSSPSSARPSSASSPSSNSNSNSNSSGNSAGAADPNQPTQAPSKPAAPNLAPPRSDRVDAGALSEDIGESSSKDTQIDLSPPENDARAHPHSTDPLADVTADTPAGTSVGEFHMWDPHKAAKSVEVGDFYFKRKNYRAAEERYREALRFKDNDAIATFRLAVCLEKVDRPGDALAEYDSYLRILPHGPLAEEAQKSIERLKQPAPKAAK
jgi:tetratricopeptide (TPR) repeat protein